MHSAVAQRQATHRERRRRKLKCVLIEIRDGEIGVLVGRGLLAPTDQGSRTAIAEALHRHLDATLSGAA